MFNPKELRSKITQDQFKRSYIPAARPAFREATPSTGDKSLQDN